MRKPKDSKKPLTLRGFFVIDILQKSSIDELLWEVLGAEAIPKADFTRPYGVVLM
jgi:hypothetical protein